MTTQEILQGVHDWTLQKVVYDISAAHLDGQGNPTPYAGLAAALGTGGANIPEGLRKGGMSIKFIQGSAQSSDNKYVQYRLMVTAFSTVTTDWTNVEVELNDVANRLTVERNARIVADTAEATTRQAAILAQNAEIAEFEETIRAQIDEYNPIVIEGNVSNAPDEEDITSVSQSGTDVLKFKNRNNLNGMGYIILRRDASVASQLTQTNTIYEIRYDFDLNGDEITIPDNCVLKFNGGKIHKGTVNLNYCYLSGNPQLWCECKGNYKNEYLNPRWFGAVGDYDKTHSYPLSSVYSTLEEAQMSYPFAVSLDDEFDYCGIQTALDLMKTTASGLLYIPKGLYKINEELVCKVGGPRIVGEMKGNTEYKAYGTILQWTGSAGTVDVPKYILKMYTTKNDGTYDPDVPFKYRHRPFVSHIGFYGKSGAIETIPGWVLDYVSGVFIGPSGMYDIKDCNFYGLYDGIVFSTSLLCDVERCWWYNIYRDCLRVVKNKVEGSTTLRILRNEFAVFGRYAIFLDGQVPEDNFIVQQCDFEGTGSGQISTANFFQGIRAVICFNGNSETIFTQNRFEALNGHQYFIHFVSAGATWIHNNVFDFQTDNRYLYRTVFICTDSGTPTQAYTDYYNEHRIADITDARNYSLPTVNNFVVNLHFYKNYCYGTRIYTLLGNTYGSIIATFPSEISQPDMNVGDIFYNWAVSNGAIDFNTPLDTAITPNLYLHCKDTLQKNMAGIYNGNSLLNDSQYRRIDLYGTTKLHIGNLSDAVDPSAEYAFFINTGPFGAPALAEGKPLFFERKTGAEAAVFTKRKIRYGQIPTTGTWSNGDIIYSNNYYSISNKSQPVGYICIESGTPGKWASFGFIQGNTAVYGKFDQRPDFLTGNDIDRGSVYYDWINGRQLYWRGHNWVDGNGYTATQRPHRGTTEQRPVALYLLKQGTTLPTNGLTMCVGYTFKNLTDNKYYIATAIDTSGNITWTEESTLHPGIPSDAIRGGYNPPNTLNFEPYVGYFYIGDTFWAAVKSYTRSGSGTEEDPYVYNVVWKSGFNNNHLTSNDVGFEYFDTTLGKPIYAKAINGNAGVITWVDATGTVV